MLSDAEDTKDHFASVFADENHFDPSLADDEEGVAGIVLEEDNTSSRIEFLAGHVSKPLEFSAI